MTAVAHGRRPEPSQRTQRILTIVFAVAIVGIMIGLIVAGARSPPGASPPGQEIQDTEP